MKMENKKQPEPLHEKGARLGSHLSRELRQKLKHRSMRVRTGDKVKVMTGQFRNKTGAVERIDVRKAKVYVTGVELSRKDGRKVKYPVHPSNLVITELIEDKRRLSA
jgi:large subunit ribosomal protein L24